VKTLAHLVVGVVATMILGFALLLLAGAWAINSLAPGTTLPTPPASAPTCRIAPCVP
jgi:hypothetical protein